MPDDHSRIDFRPLTTDDLPTLLYWLGDPDVSPWYDEGALTLENVTARFRPVIDGTEPTRGFVILIDGQPVGYIQAYLIGDHPDYQRQLDVDPRAVATDLFIGEAAYRNRGWGSLVLHAFLERIVFGEMKAGLAMIAPEPGNARAIRAYEQAGFRWLKTVHVVDEHPGNTGDEYVMLLAAVDWCQGSCDAAPDGSAMT